jgi:hypothetical protein
MKNRTRLAAFALAVPLALPVSAHAAMHANVCTVATGGTTTSFTMSCTAATPNDDSGTYSINVSWPVSPCIGTATTFTGVASGTTPEGSFSNAPALALVYPTGQPNDLSIGFSTPGSDGTERHTAQLQFTCPTGALQPNGQVSELDSTGVGSATNTAYCSYGNVVGNVTFTPPIGVSGTSHYVMRLTMNCVGNGIAGTYTVTLTGDDVGGCVTGAGSGTISGTGPGGPFSGAWMYGRSGIHYFGFPPSGTGFINMGGQTYGFYLWLDLVPPPGVTCPIPTGGIIGHSIVSGL